MIRASELKESEKVISNWSNIVQGMTYSDERKLFIHLLARLQIEQRLLEIPHKRGPKIGSVKINEEIIKSFCVALLEKKELGTTVRLSEIARTHNVSRQTIHEKWHKFLSHEKVYRKVTK